VFTVTITVKFDYCRFQSCFCDLHLFVVCFNRSDCFRGSVKRFSIFVLRVTAALEVSLCGQCKTATLSTFPGSRTLQDVYLDSWTFLLQQTVVFPLYSYMLVHTSFGLVFRRWHHSFTSCVFSSRPRMPPEVPATFPRCNQGRHGAGVMNGKPACQTLLPSSVLSRRLEHKIKHTNDKEKRKEDTRRKTTPLNGMKVIFLLAFRAIPSVLQDSVS
jgi:hypothetical protein